MCADNGAAVSDHSPQDTATLATHRSDLKLHRLQFESRFTTIIVSWEFPLAAVFALQ